MKHFRNSNSIDTYSHPWISRRALLARSTTDTSNTDNVIRDRSAMGASPNAAFVAGSTCPGGVHGNQAITNQATNPRTFLISAYEIIDNWRLNPNGNNNGLCESNEACIYMPNFGSYQGEGDYQAAGTCTFQNGTVSNVKMYAYPTNGG